MALTKLTTDLIDSTIVTSVNGSTGAVTLETGTDWQATPKTADFTAVAGEGYFVDTTSAAITVTLPSSPSSGDEVNLVDYAGTAATNNITITSSNNIKGASNDVKINYPRGGVSIVYVDANQGWIAYNSTNEANKALPADLPASFTTNYLVVAGGGSGGDGDLAGSGGGGGAGGLRTSFGSTTGGGGAAESSLTLSVSTGYSITVGAGAAGSSGQGGGSGSNSTFSTITSTGGGGGARANGAGTNGGSGGGGGLSTNEGLAVTSPVVQGYDGGEGFHSGSNYPCGGGGGAGAEGDNATSGSSNPNGGVGLAVNIISTTNASASSVGEVSGSDVYFAGGGGYGRYNTTTGGFGGLGGGGDNNTDGTGNTGGGGGGVSAATTSGAGGSGIVILRYPTGYSLTVAAGITQASGSPFYRGRL